MIGPAFALAEWAPENARTEAKPVLTLDRLGGPPLPEYSELRERVAAVRDLLTTLVPKFADLSPSELEKGSGHLASEDDEDPYIQEAVRLMDAANTIFQLHDEMPVPKRGKTHLYREAKKIWKDEGEGENPTSQWFKRFRLDFVCNTLAGWIIETEEAYREANSFPPDSESDSEPPPAATSAEAASPSEDAPDALEELPPPEPANGEVADGAENDDDPGDENPADLGDEQLVVLVPPDELSRRLRIGRLTGGAFAIALVVGALAAAFVLLGGEGESSGGTAGEIRRVLNVTAPEDLAVANGFVWLVNANDETAIRVSEAEGKQETIFVDQPPFVSKPLPGTRTGARVGGYRVTAGPDRAWIVTNGGVVLAIGTTSRKTEVLNPHIKILAGKPVLYRGSLWVAGFGGYLFRLRARDGAIQREFRLHGDPFVIDSLAAGVGSIWAYNDGSSDDPKINVLTPVPDRLGVEESVLPLDLPAFDLAAGLGGVWTVDSGGTVTWHDPATGGSSRPIQVPGGAREIALSRDAVWVTTGNNAAVRIDPITLATVGEPIKLPGDPVALGADENVWVATPKKLVEIES